MILKTKIMKKKLLTLLMIALTTIGLFAQESSTRLKIYRTWVSLNREPFKIEGSLYQINDSSIVVSSSFKRQDYAENKYEIVEKHIDDIETIKTRRYRSIEAGAWLGAFTGFTVGFVTGVSTAEYSYLDELQVGLILGIPSAVAGAALGAIGGSFKRKIPIHGSIDYYNRSKNKLREYSINHYKQNNDLSRFEVP